MKNIFRLSFIAVFFVCFLVESAEYLGVGSKITVEPSSFGLAAFTEKMKFTVEYTNPISEHPASLDLKVVAFSTTSVTLEMVKAVKLYDEKELKGTVISTELMKDPSPVQDLKVTGFYAIQGLSKNQFTENVYFVNPFIINIQHLEGTSVYTFTGKFTGSTVPRLTMEVVKNGKAKYVICKIDGKSWIFSPTTGIGQFNFEKPAVAPEDGTETGYFILRNKSGICMGKEDIDVETAYLAAVEDAAAREYSEICTTLTAVNSYNDNLTWNQAHDHILVVSWLYNTSYDPTWTGNPNWVSKLKPGDTVSTQYGPLFVTIVPDLKSYAQKNKFVFQTDENVRYRVAELLGINPRFIDGDPNLGRRKNAFLEVWVKPEDIIRPSPDPEITDTMSEMDFTYTGNSVLTVLEVWQDWYDYKFEHSYDFVDPMEKWPFTGFGYAYDWGNPGTTRVGMSEFLIRGGSNSENPNDLGTAYYIVNQVSPTYDYLTEGAGD